MLIVHLGRSWRCPLNRGFAIIHQKYSRVFLSCNRLLYKTSVFFLESSFSQWDLYFSRGVEVTDPGGRAALPCLAYTGTWDWARYGFRELCLKQCTISLFGVFNRGSFCMEAFKSVKAANERSACIWIAEYIFRPLTKITVTKVYKNRELNYTLKHERRESTK